MRFCNSLKNHGISHGMAIHETWMNHGWKSMKDQSSRYLLTAIGSEALLQADVFGQFLQQNHAKHLNQHDLEKFELNCFAWKFASTFILLCLQKFGIYPCDENPLLCSRIKLIFNKRCRNNLW